VASLLFGPAVGRLNPLEAGVSADLRDGGPLDGGPRLSAR
jgi:hypothetical protein